MNLKEININTRIHLRIEIIGEPLILRVPYCMELYIVGDIFFSGIRQCKFEYGYGYGIRLWKFDYDMAMELDNGN